MDFSADVAISFTISFPIPVFFAEHFFAMRYIDKIKTEQLGWGEEQALEKVIFAGGKMRITVEQECIFLLSTKIESSFGCLSVW